MLQSEEATVAALARVVEVKLETVDLTIQKYRVLSYLALAPATPSQLAARLNVRGPTVTRLVDGLVDRGLVERRVDEDDRRRSLHLLTRAGVAALRRADAAIGAALDNLARHLDSDERRQAERGLHLWARAMREEWLAIHGAETGLAVRS